MTKVCDFQDWPILIKHDAVPPQNISYASISSTEDLILRVSPACLDSIMDCTAFLEVFLGDNHRAGDETTDMADKLQRSARSNRPRGSMHRSRKVKSSLFKVMNCSGLGVACYPESAQRNSVARMELAPTGQAIPLRFHPQQEMVYLPDLARTVCIASWFSCHAEFPRVHTIKNGTVQVTSRTVTIQLESSFIGSIKAIKHVVVDKVGVYTYPLQTHGQQVSQTRQPFQYAVVVSVHLDHRTKVVSIQTPYRLLNKCALPLQVKVWGSASASLLMSIDVGMH